MDLFLDCLSIVVPVYDEAESLPELADRIIDEGQADLVAIGRELLADSAFVHRAALALGLENPHRVLPEGLSFWLERRRFAQ